MEVVLFTPFLLIRITPRLSAFTFITHCQSFLYNHTHCLVGHRHQKHMPRESSVTHGPLLLFFGTDITTLCFQMLGTMPSFQHSLNIPNVHQNDVVISAQLSAHLSLEPLCPSTSLRPTPLSAPLCLHQGVRCYSACSILTFPYPLTRLSSIQGSLKVVLPHSITTSLPCVSLPSYPSLSTHCAPFVHHLQLFQFFPPSLQMFHQFHFPSIRPPHFAIILCLLPLGLYTSTSQLLLNENTKRLCPAIFLVNQGCPPTSSSLLLSNLYQPCF